MMATQQPRPHSGDTRPLTSKTQPIKTIEPTVMIRRPRPRWHWILMGLVGVGLLAAVIVALVLLTQSDCDCEDYGATLTLISRDGATAQVVIGSAVNSASTADANALLSAHYAQTAQANLAQSDLRAALARSTSDAALATLSIQSTLLASGADTSSFLNAQLNTLSAQATGAAQSLGETFLTATAWQNELNELEATLVEQNMQLTQVVGSATAFATQRQPTATLTESATATASSTPRPSATARPTRTASPSPTLILPPATSAPPQGGSSPQGFLRVLPDDQDYPFRPEAAEVAFGPAIFHADCGWQGVGGQVFGLDGQGLNGLEIRVEGIPIRSQLSGSRAEYGEAGYEIQMENGAASDVYRLRLFQGNMPLSAVVEVSFSGRCDENLLRLNFRQVQAYSPVG